MAVKMTPETYSGVAVDAIEATDRPRSSSRPLAHAGQHADQQRHRHHHEHDPEHQDARRLQRFGQSLRDRRAEGGGTAEIALQHAGEAGLRRLGAEPEPRPRLALSPDR